MNNVMKQYPPRPTLTKEAKRKAIIEWSKRLDDLVNLWSDKEDIVEALIEWAHQSDDGYELAKKIEVEHGINISFDLCEALDCVGSKLKEAHRQLIKEWVEINHITPPFAVGTHVSWIDSGYVRKKGIIAETNYNKYGKVAVAEDGDTNNGHWLVNFEDVELLEEETA